MQTLQNESDGTSRCLPPVLPPPPLLLLPVLAAEVVKRSFITVKTVPSSCVSRMTEQRGRRRWSAAREDVVVVVASSDSFASFAGRLLELTRRRRSAKQEPLPSKTGQRGAGREEQRERRRCAIFAFLPFIPSSSSSPSSLLLSPSLSPPSTHQHCSAFPSDDSPLELLWSLLLPASCTRTSSSASDAAIINCSTSLGAVILNDFRLCPQSKLLAGAWNNKASRNRHASDTRWDQLTDCDSRRVPPTTSSSSSIDRRTSYFLLIQSPAQGRVLVGAASREDACCSADNSCYTRMPRVCVQVRG